MALKLLKYFLFFCVFIMIFLLTKNPYLLEYKSNSIDKPEIEIFGMESYEISLAGVGSIIIAKKLERYKNYDKMYNIKALHEGKLELIDSLVADKGMLSQNILYLDKNVKYTRSDELALSANSVKYDITNKILSSNTPFELTKKSMKTYGNAFTYDMQKGIIRATKIKTVIKNGG